MIRPTRLVVIRRGRRYVMRWLLWLGLLAMVLPARTAPVSTPMPSPDVREHAVDTPSPSGPISGSDKLLPEESPPRGAEGE
jgi:hypothetical protein